MEPARSVLDQALSLVESQMDLSGFLAVPERLASQGLAPHTVPATALFASDNAPDAPVARQLLQAARAAAASLHWRQSYTADQVGQYFLNRYGFVELAGPTGHFAWATGRLFLGYWGAGLRYDWHWHPAEEVYFVLSGDAVFQTEARTRKVGPGGAVLHRSNEPHAMSVGDKGVTLLALWRGEGLGAPSQMPGTRHIGDPRTARKVHEPADCVAPSLDPANAARQGVPDRWPQSPSSSE